MYVVKSGIAMYVMKSDIAMYVVKSDIIQKRMPCASDLSKDTVMCNNCQVFSVHVHVGMSGQHDWA